MQLGGPHGLEEQRGDAEAPGARLILLLQSPAGDEDQRHLGIALPDPLGQLPAVHARHPDIGHDEVEASADEDAEGLGPAAHGHDVMAGVTQHLAEDAHDLGVIVDEENASLAAGRGLGLRRGVGVTAVPIGRTTVKVVPPPGRLSTRISPPCRFTIE